MGARLRSMYCIRFAALWALVIPKKTVSGKCCRFGGGDITAAISKDETSSLATKNDSDVDYEELLDGKLPERDESSTIPEDQSDGYSTSQYVAKSLSGTYTYLRNQHNQTKQRKSSKLNCSSKTM